MRELTQRELQDESDEIIRALESGESFIVTHAGVPVGELTPIMRPTFVPVDEVKRVFAGAPHVDYEGLRRDLDEYVDQDPTPRV